MRSELHKNAQFLNIYENFQTIIFTRAIKIIICQFLDFFAQLSLPPVKRGKLYECMGNPRDGSSQMTIKNPPCRLCKLHLHSQQSRRIDFQTA